MSKESTSTDDLFEQQMHALERGQRTLIQSTTVPFRQAIEVQRNLGEVFLSGIELNQSLQRMGVDLTRSAFRRYLNSFEDVITDVSSGEDVRETPGTQQAPPPGQSQYGNVPPYGQQSPYGQQFPPQQAPPQRTPLQRTPSQQIPPQQTPPQQAPHRQTPPQQAPLQQAPPRQTPPQQAPPQQVPDESPSEQQQSEPGRQRSPQAGPSR